MSRFLFVVFFILTMFFSVCFTKEASAQIVNIQRNLKFNFEDGIYAGAYSGIQNYVGNTNLFSVDASVELLFNYKNNMLFLLVSGKYLRTDPSDALTFSTFEHLRYSYEFYNWLRLEVFLQHEYNKSKRLRLRMLSGVGPRFTPLLLDVVAISIGTSYMFEYNQNTIKEGYADSGRKHYLHRWNNYLHIDVSVTEDISFYTTFYIQPDILDFGNYTMLLDSQFEFQITKYVSINVSSDFYYNSRPHFGVVVYDYAVTFGLGYKYSSSLSSL